jgi:hypothetical protein
VRRLVALFVLAVIGATLYGLSSSSSGIIVNDQTVSANTFRSELSALSHNDTLQCYITALDPVSYAPGAGDYSIKAAGAAAWANLRVEGLAINQYVTTQMKYHPNASQLALAKSSLEGEMTQADTTNAMNCPGTSSEALVEMPSEMRTAEIQAQATSLYLVAKLKKAKPLTTASMKSYFAQHTSNYDTLCISAALVLPSDVNAFAKTQAAGASVAVLAKEYSQDPTSAAKGGALGCFTPSEDAYSEVRTAATSPTLNTFPTTPEAVKEGNGETYALYVAVTKRSANTFSVAAATVLADLKALNASSANTLKDHLLFAAAVHVDPAFGRWGLNAAGPEVFAPATPTKSDVIGTKKLNATGSSTYK